MDNRDSKSTKPTAEQFLAHKAQQRHKRENPLRDVILGGQDGLVNALGIILGVSAASGDVKILIATVLAATFAESLSMGAVAYTSAISQRDYYRSERRKELKEIEEFPEMEKEEIRQIYEGKGFKGRVLEEIVEVTSSNKEAWVNLMMAEELKIQPVYTKAVLKSSVIVTIATTLGHLIPLLPYFFLASHSALIASIVISGITLFAVGAYQAISLIGSWWKNGLRMVLIGLTAAFLGFLIAKLFHAVA